MPKAALGDRLKHAWSLFRSEPNLGEAYFPAYYTDVADYGIGSSSRPDKPRFRPSTERSMVSSMYNKIANDVAAVQFRHVKTDKNGRYSDTIDSGLNNCLTVEANIDQTGRSFIFDAVLSMFDEGVVALVPTVTNVSLKVSNSFDILSMRVGKIVQWYPQHVRVDLYDENDGRHKEITLEKRKIAIVENPFYSVMNEPNSTLKRLVRKLNLLDTLDQKQDPSKFNMILQLPYMTRSPARKKEAQKRRDELESQLTNSKYGVAYIDGTEKIHQLNGSIDNNLVTEAKELKEDLYSQMGITKEVFDGTADEKTMLNYRNSTIEVISSAFADEMTRKFLTKTARTQGQKVMFFQDLFKLVPMNEIAEISDKFTRNEIASANEMRSVIGFKPVNDERADELRNRNLNKSDEEFENPVMVDTEDEEY